MYLPEYAAFTNEFVEECASFPNGVNDDMVDQATQAITRFMFWGASVKADEKTDLQKHKHKLLKQTRTTNKSRRY